MSVLLGFFSSMFGKESTSPTSGFIEKAYRSFCSSAPATMPSLGGNSLRNSSSPRRPQIFSRLDSTGETIEIPASPSSNVNQSVLPDLSKFYSQSQPGKLCSFSTVGFPATAHTEVRSAMSMMKSPSSTENNNQWQPFSPQSSAITESKQINLYPISTVQTSQSTICASTLASTTPISTAVRMTSSCSSLPCTKVVAPELVHGKGTITASASTLLVPPPRPLFCSSPKKEFSISAPKSPEKPILDQCRYLLTFVSSSESELDTSAEKKSAPAACVKPAAMAEVNVKLQFTSPQCSSNKSRKKKSRPSAKKRHRNHQKRDGSPSEHCTESSTSMESPSHSPAQSPQKRKPSQSACTATTSQSPQSFTVTFRDISEHDTSTESITSPRVGSKDNKCSKFSFLIEPDLSSDFEVHFEDDEENAQPDSSSAGKSPSTCSKVLAVIESEDFDESETSGSVSDDEGWDGEWDDEEDCAKEDVWESLSNQALVDVMSFTCRVEPVIVFETDSESEAGKLAREANDRWEEAYGAVKTPAAKKTTVGFPAEASELATVEVMEETDDFAYAAARIGLWEQYGRDAERFRNRINAVEKAIQHIFTTEHRTQVYKDRFTNTE